jgi:hypothetical protein
MGIDLVFLFKKDAYVISNYTIKAEIEKNKGILYKSNAK